MMMLHNYNVSVKYLGSLVDTVPVHAETPLDACNLAERFMLARKDCKVTVILRDGNKRTATKLYLYTARQVSCGASRAT